jgi:hypothetical protein
MAAIASRRRPQARAMRLNDMRPPTIRLLLGVSLISVGCYDFHVTGPEDPPPVVRPTLVDVTVEYRQPNQCFASDRCDDNVVFLASWLPTQINPQGQVSGGFMFLSRVSAFVWRGVAHDVPVNYPPKDDAHVVAIYDPHLRDTATGGRAAARLQVGREALTVFLDPGTPNEAAFVYIDENGFGHNPF